MNILVIHQNYLEHENAQRPDAKQLFNPKEFDIFSKNQIGVYNEYVNSLNNKHGHRPEWWATSVSSRNIFFSPFFLIWCFIHYAFKKNDEEKLDEIVCESELIKQALLSNPKMQNVKITVANQQTWRQKIKFLFLLRFLYSTLFFASRCLRHCYFAKKTRGNTEILESASICLVDTFVQEKAFANREYLDPYFGSFIRNTPEKNWHYLPYLNRIQNLKQCYTNMRTCKVPFIVMEDYLKIWDYFWAIGASLKILFVQFDSDIFSAILQNEIRSLFSRDNMTFLLRYRFAKRLAQKNIKVNGLLDWYEAQPLDNVQNLGFRTFFKNMKIASYVGAFFSPFQAIGYQVLTSEVSHHVSAHKIFFYGSGIVANFTNLPGVKYECAPAFRISKKDFLPSANEDNYFIVLPNMIPQAEEIIDFISQSDLKNKKLFISLHPSTHKEHLKNYISSKFGNKFTYTYVERLSEAVSQAEIVISTGTSAFVDAFMMKIPCIVVGSRTKHTLNFIPEKFNNVLFQIVYRPKTLQSSIDELLKSSKEKSLNFDLFFKDFVQPQTQTDVTLFAHNLFSTCDKNVYA